MVSLIVSKLNRLEEVANEIHFLARRHVEYGAKPEYFPVVGECLLLTLKERLGIKWNTEVEAAWTSVYTLLSGAMIAIGNEYR
jgi:hemoglobin-like flavoprotein